MPTVTILGRRFSLGPPLRMAEMAKSPLAHKFQGHVVGSNAEHLDTHHDYGPAVRNMTGVLRRDYNANRAARSLAKRALTGEGMPGHLRDTIEHAGHDDFLHLVADQNGTVTAHHHHGDEAHDPPVESLIANHKKAAGNGHTFVTSHFHEQIPAFLAAMGASPRDQSPALIFSDFLSENGYEPQAQYIKDHIAKHGRPPSSLVMAHALEGVGVQQHSLPVPGLRLSFEAEPPIKTTIHGLMADPQSDEAVRGHSDNETHLLNDHAKAAAAAFHGKSHDEPWHFHDHRIDSDVGGAPTHVLLTSDKEGNVVGHAGLGQHVHPHPYEAAAEWLNTPEDQKERYRENLARSPLYRNNPRHWDDLVGGLQRNHTRAVSKNRLYAKQEIHPDIKPFLDAHAEAYRNRRPIPGLEHSGRTQWDESPQLILADHLEEQGYPLSQLLRAHPQMHPEMLHHVLHHTDASQINPEIMRAIETEARHRGNQLSLQHSIPVQFGPALPWRTRSYRPKPRPTDLRENEWSKIHRFFPEPNMGPRNRRTPVRTLLNATLYRLENEIPLRELERDNPDLPPWGSVHALEARISEAHLWPQIIEAIGRTHLMEILPKMIHSASDSSSGLLGRPTAKVNIEGLATQAS